LKNIKANKYKKEQPEPAVLFSYNLIIFVLLSAAFSAKTVPTQAPQYR
jgi:hypothetical protein